MERTKVFISYSHHDARWLGRLQTYLKPLERDGRLDRWDDSRIEAGGDWHAEIQQALGAAAIAVLLVSQDFLASDYIHEHELPALLDAAEAGGVLILPIFVRTSNYDLTPLKRFQGVNSPKRPLNSLPEHEQDAVLDKAARAVLAALDRRATQRTDRTAPAPQTIWTVPHQQNFFFTGREALLARLHADLERRGRAMLSGLGGVGKTQAAVEYAFRHREAYRAVLWVGAEAPEALAANVAALAHALNLPEARAREQARQVAAVQRWLADHDGWLLVFDSADAAPGETLAPFWPEGGTGHVLVTSRKNHAQRLGIQKGLQITELPPDEALAFLLKRTGRDDAGAVERDAAAALAEAVDGLPLALEQAAAYLVEVTASFVDYLAAYRRQPLDVLERGQPVAGGYREGVAKTWLLNFEQVEAENQAAADVLRAAAFLAPDDVPLELFEEGAAELGAPLAAALGDGDSLAINAVLTPLTRFSLIHRDPNRHTFDVHRLVQEVVRAGLSEAERSTWERRVLRAVNAVFPEAEFRAWPLCERLLPHARVVITRTSEDTEEPVAASVLFDKAAKYFLNPLAEYREAELLFRRALALIEKVYEPGHPDLAIALNNLALLLFNQKRYGEAESLFQNALDIHEQAFGSEHPATAHSLSNLAGVLDGQGRYGEAEALYRRGLEIFEGTLGFEHPISVQSLSNFAVLLFKQGHPDEAETLYRRVLAIRERTSGPEHPHTAQSLSNLAELLENQGRHDEAEPLSRRALSIRERTLGPEHPDTAQSLNNLGTLLKSQGRYDEAELRYRRALGIAENVLGPEHPDTATTLNNLARLLENQGRHDEAEPLYRRALDLHEKVLGPGHPHTQIVRENYEAFQQARRGEP